MVITLSGRVTSESPREEVQDQHIAAATGSEAVAAVVVYHAWPEVSQVVGSACRFFTLSGFLITTIVTRTTNSVGRHGLLAASSLRLLPLPLLQLLSRLLRCRH